MANDVKILYNDLSANKNSVCNKINALLDTIDEINNQCSEITSEESWYGITSTNFLTSSNNIYKNSIENILSLRDTNEYKQITINTFLDVENDIGKNYKV